MMKTKLLKKTIIIIITIMEVIKKSMKLRTIIIKIQKQTLMKIGTNEKNNIISIFKFPIIPLFCLFLLDFFVSFYFVFPIN